MDVGCIQEIRTDARRAQHVAHQRTAAGTEFDQMKALRPAAILPDLHEEKADQLAKNLADLGRRDEVARDWIPPRVIAGMRIGERDAHKFRDCDRAGFGDDTPDVAGAVVHRAGLGR